jgi:hypothetical protein
MIIDDNFIWLHMAKMGGDSTRSLFAILLPDLVIHTEPDSQEHLEYKHDHLISRKNKDPKFIFADKDCILNFRRLPNFIRSFNIHLIHASAKYLYMQETMASQQSKNAKEIKKAFVRAKKEIRIPQSYLTDMNLFGTGIVWTVNPSFYMIQDVVTKTPKRFYGVRADDVLLSYMNGCSNIQWLRVEQLQEDFITCMEKYFGFISDEKKAQFLSQTPKNQTKNREQFPIHLNPKQLKNLYHNNPIWTQLERELYGFALVDKV